MSWCRWAQENFRRRQGPASQRTDFQAIDFSAALLRFSTDYVFDGSHTGPYTEEMPTRLLNVYGITKRDGELAIAASGVPHWILRTSWGYNLHGGNFMKTAILLG